MRYLAIMFSITLLGFVGCMIDEEMADVSDETADLQALEEAGLSPDPSELASDEDAAGEPELAGSGALAALAGPYWWRSVATLRCLDSNTLGQVYTLGCNGGSFQKWYWTGSSSSVEHRNLATGFCLNDSPSGSRVYASACNGHSTQRWRRNGLRWINVYSGRCLDSNTLGEVYTLACNGGNFQNWE